MLLLRATTTGIAAICAHWHYLPFLTVACCGAPMLASIGFFGQKARIYSYAHGNKIAVNVADEKDGEVARHEARAKARGTEEHAERKAARKCIDRE